MSRVQAYRRSLGYSVILCAASSVCPLSYQSETDAFPPLLPTQVICLANISPPVSPPVEFPIPFSPTNLVCRNDPTLGSDFRRSPRSNPRRTEERLDSWVRYRSNTFDRDAKQSRWPGMGRYRDITWNLLTVREIAAGGVWWKWLPVYPRHQSGPRCAVN